MANAGILYEQHLFNYLNGGGYIPSGTTVAGAKDSIPDITIQNKATPPVQAGVEVKLDPKAAFGSAVFQFDYSQIALGARGNPWVIPQEPSGTAKWYMSQDARTTLLPQVQKLWWTDNIITGQHYVPHGVKAVSPTAKDAWLKASPVGNHYKTITYPNNYNEDAQNLKGFKVVSEGKETLWEEDLGDEWTEVKTTSGKTGFRVPASAQVIRNYYISKSSWYIQIGSDSSGNNGLYHMGDKDPLDLGRYGCPLFNPSTVEYRVRVAEKSGRYSIQYALYIGGLSTSPLSLPINQGTGNNYSRLVPNSVRPQPSFGSTAISFLD